MSCSMKYILLNGVLTVVLIVSCFAPSQCCSIPQSKSVFFGQKTIALVLARGGSKGIPLKNLARLRGQTLISRTVRTLLKLNRFDEVWVSTDNGLIIEDVSGISKHVNIHLRSPETATDVATSIFAVQEFTKHHPDYDVIALVQCTSPFLQEIYLDQALDKINNRDCCFSVQRSCNLRWTRNLVENRISPVNFDVENRPRRQDLHDELVENGMFLISTKKLILSGRFQNGKKKRDWSELATFSILPSLWAGEIHASFKQSGDVCEQFSYLSNNFIEQWFQDFCVEFISITILRTSF